MNYQNQTDNRDEAAKELGVPSSYLDYYAWPQTFGSTAGPFGGIGGKAISSFTIEAYADGKDAVIFCKQKRVKRVDNQKSVDAMIKALLDVKSHLAA